MLFPDHLRFFLTHMVNYLNINIIIIKQCLYGVYLPLNKLFNHINYL